MTSHAARVTAFYDAVAEIYDDGSFRGPIRNWYRSLAGDLARRKVFDAGCRAGVDAAAFGQTAASVVAADISPKMVDVDLATARCSEMPCVRVIHGDTEEIARTHGPFDRIFSTMEIFYHPDVGRAIRAYADATRPAGRLVLVTNHPIRNTLLRADDNFYFTGPFDETWSTGRAITKWHQPLETYVKQFDAAGFRLVALQERSPTDDVRRLQDHALDQFRYPAFLALVGGKP